MMISKADAIWSGYYAVRLQCGSALEHWLRTLAAGIDDEFWRNQAAEHAEVATILFGEYRRLLRASGRRRRAA